MPEVQRAELSGVVLQLKALGLHNMVTFPWLSPPPAEAMVRALELLHALHALDASAKYAAGSHTVCCSCQATRLQETLPQQTSALKNIQSQEHAQQLQRASAAFVKHEPAAACPEALHALQPAHVCNLDHQCCTLAAQCSDLLAGRCMLAAVAASA